LLRGRAFTLDIAWRRAGCSERTGFNPHPIRKQGATVTTQRSRYSMTTEFQSSPHPKTGCDGAKSSIYLRLLSFPLRQKPEATAIGDEMLGGDRYSYANLVPASTTTGGPRK